MRLRTSASTGLSRQASRLEQLAASLDHLSPQAVLQRGYSLVRKTDGSIVRDAAQLTDAESVQLSFGTGAADAQITRLKGR